MEFCAKCAVNMLQNISQNRIGKIISETDIFNICKAWSLSVGFNARMFMTIVFVQGTGNDLCKVMWLYCSERKSSNQQWTRYLYSYTQGSRLASGSACTLYYNSSEKIKENGISTNIFPDWHIKNGETKAEIEISFHGGSVSRDIGLRTLNLKGYKNQSLTYFPCHVIFSPKPGIFDPDNLPS